MPTTPDAVPGEVIEAAWGDAVRNDLNNLELTRVLRGGDTMTGHLSLPTYPPPSGLQAVTRFFTAEMGPHHVRYTNPSNTDGGGAAWTTIASPGNVTVPPGAVAVVTDTFVSGLFATTTGAPVYLFRTVLGGNDSPGDGVVNFKPSELIGERRNTAWSSYYTGLTPGSTPLIVQAIRQAGTGVVRCDTSTLWTFSINFRAG